MYNRTSSSPSIAFLDVNLFMAVQVASRGTNRARKEDVQGNNPQQRSQLHGRYGVLGKAHLLCLLQHSGFGDIAGRRGVDGPLTPPPLHPPGFFPHLTSPS